MARPSKVSAADIEDAATTLVREHGMDALTARAVADALGVSTQPVYSTWGSMDALKARSRRQGRAAHRGVPPPAGTGGAPPMLSLGLRTVRLARDEPALFAIAAAWMRAAFDQPPPATLLTAMRADPRLAAADDEHLRHINAQLWIVTQGLASMVRPLDADPAGGGITLETARAYLTAIGEAIVTDAARRG
ncbi:MAG: helix-turn-helix domain-containing protein [Dermatophilaceae bacterium]